MSAWRWIFPAILWLVSPAFGCGPVADLMNFDSSNGAFELQVDGGTDERAAPARQEKKGRLVGRVVWKGPRFAARDVVWPEGVRGSDLKLERLLATVKPRDERVTIDPENGGVKDCLVILPDLRLPETAPRIIEARVASLRITPHRIVVPDGWAFRLANLDPIDHAFELRCRGEVLSRHHLKPKETMTLPQLDRDGCELVSSKFPFLRATLHRRLRRPTIVTDVNGSFRIDGIDAGKLKLLFEHPSFGQLEKTVTIDEGAELKLEVDIADLTASGVTRSFAFPLGGKALFKIDGVVCGQHDFDRLVSFYRARHAPFELGRHWFEVEVLRRAVIPLAAMLASRPQDRLAREAGARRILALLNLGQTFEELAARFSDEAAPRRGILLEDRGRADLDPCLGAAVFETPVGRVSSPFWTTRGLHLVKIVARRGQGADEKRDFRNIVLAWEGKPDWNRWDREAADRAKKARVEVLDPAKADLVPEANRR